MSASLVDFGLYFYLNAAELIDRVSGPYFYLPKMESHKSVATLSDFPLQHSFSHFLLVISHCYSVLRCGCAVTQGGSSVE